MQSNDDEYREHMNDDVVHAMLVRTSNRAAIAHADFSHEAIAQLSKGRPLGAPAWLV
jgi:hypothetical protein